MYCLKGRRVDRSGLPCMQGNHGTRSIHSRVGRPSHRRRRWRRCQEYPLTCGMTSPLSSRTASTGVSSPVWDHPGRGPRLFHRLGVSSPARGYPIRTVAKPRFSIVGRFEKLRFAPQAWIWPPCDGQLQASHHHYDGGCLIGASQYPSNDPKVVGIGFSTPVVRIPTPRVRFVSCTSLLCSHP